MLVSAVRHYLGAYLVELGGADAIVFTGGIGKNRVEFRAAVLRDLEELGIVLDPAANRQAKGEAPIHAPHSRVQIWVVPTNEELIVARLAKTLIGGLGDVRRQSDRIAGSTQKTAAMVGHKLLVVEPYRVDEARRGMKSVGRTLVAVDTVGAGEGEFVLVTQGSSARLTPETKNLPVDTVIIGIVDSVHVGQACVYDKEEGARD